MLMRMLARAATPLEPYRRRVELTRALAAVEAAIALRDEQGRGGSPFANLDRLRDDLLVALRPSEIMLPTHRRVSPLKDDAGGPPPRRARAPFPAPRRRGGP